MEYCGEVLTIKLLKKLKCDIQQSTNLTADAKKAFTYLIDTFIELIPIVKAVHRSVFYITGGKYQISKRLFGINYVLVRYWLKQDHSVYGYKVLGAITLLQTLITIFMFIKKHVKTQSAHQRPQAPQKVDLRDFNRPKSENKTDRTCILCMDTRVNSATIPCGHIFCWNCILEWLSQRNECPICRESTKPSQAIFLLNYQNV